VSTNNANNKRCRSSAFKKSKKKKRRRCGGEYIKKPGPLKKRNRGGRGGTGPEAWEKKYVNSKSGENGDLKLPSPERGGGEGGEGQDWRNFTNPSGGGDQGVGMCLLQLFMKGTRIAERKKSVSVLGRRHVARGPKVTGQGEGPAEKKRAEPAKTRIWGKKSEA